ncbi:hypothetical protein OBBRIDRAFT_808600 [Obba rivulosa]|uniref:Uncharacterized protein n=1 Tax=Obba rivulosa TaxID=1052685 RepID=A0A8E2DIP0_9APHY|nr:hypothetical protein OBBRIDRAFT_808600 [Obba rivulosa]
MCSLRSNGLAASPSEQFRLDSMPTSLVSFIRFLITREHLFPPMLALCLSRDFGRNAGVPRMRLRRLHFSLTHSGLWSLSFDMFFEHSKVGLESRVKSLIPVGLICWVVGTEDLGNLSHCSPLLKFSSPVCLDDVHTGLDNRVDAPREQPERSLAARLLHKIRYSPRGGQDTLTARERRGLAQARKTRKSAALLGSSASSSWDETLRGLDSCK